MVSTYVVCRDEARLIEACLRSASFSDQIVVVDSGSTDGTLEIVRGLAGEGLPIELHEREWPGYAKQKQFALERCIGEWCINLDADEELAPGFAEALHAILPGTTASGFRVMGRFELLGLGMPPIGVASWPLRRITRRGRARFDTSTLVHEHLIIDGRVETRRDLVLLHRRAGAVDELVAKEAGYGGLKARQVRAGGRRGNGFKLLMNPTYAFLRTYVGRRYFLAGWPGYIAARRLASYVFVTEARLMELGWERRSRTDARGTADAAKDGTGAAK